MKAKIFPRVHAINSTGQNARPGARIQLFQLGSVPQNPKEKTLLARFERRLKKGVSEGWKVDGKRILSLRAKILVLQTSIRLREKFGGRDPTHFHVLGAIAKDHGLNSFELRHAATAMVNMYTSYRTQATWDGAPNQLYRAITLNLPGRQGNYPSGIEAHLRKQGGALLDSMELARQIGVQTNIDEINHINVSMQLLAITGHVKKYPEVTNRTSGGTISMWGHTQNSPRLDSYKDRWGNFRNTSLYILNAISAKPRRVTDLFKPKIGRHHIAGNPKAIYSDTSIYGAVGALANAGIIKVRNRQFKNAVNSTITVQEVFLATKWKEVWSIAARTNTFPEVLRLALLGEKTA